MPTDPNNISYFASAFLHLKIVQRWLKNKSDWDITILSDGSGDIYSCFDYMAPLICFDNFKDLNAKMSFIVERVPVNTTEAELVNLLNEEF